MSAESVQQILGRTVTDTEFRKLLSNNVHQALDGYNLADDEVKLPTHASRCPLTKAALSFVGLRYRQIERAVTKKR